MYQNTTVLKYVANCHGVARKYEGKPVASIPMCISTGNKKIGRILNVSIPAVITCHNCKECKHLCYDIKACFAYPGCLDARIRNYAVLSMDRNEYFNRIKAKLAKRRTNKFFRWHVAGDIIDYNYFSRMVETAIEFPEFVFWTYTKNYTVVNDFVKDNGNCKELAIPPNLHIMFSEWRGMELINPFNFPIFTVRFNGEDEKQFRDEHKVSHKCPGNCDICKQRRSGCVVGQSTYCDEH